MIDKRLATVETLIVKVTHRCNLDCLYCYENVSKQGEDMSLDTFRELAYQLITNSQSAQLTFLFHGGEPTLLPNAWYEAAITYAENLAEEKEKKLKWLMQSNLLSLPKAKIALFDSYRIHIGASIDSHPAMEKSWRGGEEKVWQNIQALKAAGVKVGLLSTINASNFNQFGKICSWLGEEGFRQFKANVVTPVGRGGSSYPLPADLVFEAQHDILEYLIRTKGKKLHESNLSTEIRRFFEPQREQSLCHERTCGAGKKVLGITPKGDLLPCGRFQWDDKAYFLGNLKHKASSLMEAQDFQAKLSRFHEAFPKNWYDCDSCEARKICGFGCQAFISRSKAKANLDCLPTKMRYDFFVKNKKYLEPVYEEICRRASPQHFSDKRKKTFWKRLKGV